MEGESRYFLVPVKTLSLMTETEDEEKGEVDNYIYVTSNIMTSFLITFIYLFVFDKQ